MHRAKAKSAPPRLKSKFFKNRTNAMKEIEAWVRKDNESFNVPEASRMSGQLSDNVTEERMLKAKLWELSKERYKFLSQNMYEKKVFQDRQQKKASLRRVVSASAGSRQRHPSVESKTERRSSFGDAAPKPRIRNARLALLERLDPTKGKKSAIRKASTEETNDGAKTSALKSLSRENSTTNVIKRNESNLSLLSVKGSNGLKMPAKIMQSSKTVNGQQENESVSAEKPTPLSSSSVPSFTKRPKSSANNPTPSTRLNLSSNPQSNSSFVVKSTHLTPTSSHSQEAGIAVSWQNKASGDVPLKYGMKVESKTSDPRYSSLESRLCPLVRSKTTGDIKDIVSDIESLHVRPKKRPTEANRTRIEAKACEFMKEKGFAF